MDGYSNDSRKSAEAQLLGYLVIYVTPQMLNNTDGYKWSEAIDLIERALKASNKSGLSPDSVESHENGARRPASRILRVEGE